MGRPKGGIPWTKGKKFPGVGGRPALPDTKERKAARYKTDPEYARECQSRALERTKGITLDQYEEKLRSQNYLCDACKKPLDLSGRRPPLDHNHDTGQNRGIIHKGCNIALGEMKDDPVSLRLLADYLDKWKGSR